GDGAVFAGAALAGAGPAAVFLGDHGPRLRRTVLSRLPPWGAAGPSRPEGGLRERGGLRRRAYVSRPLFAPVDHRCPPGPDLRAGGQLGCPHRRPRHRQPGGGAERPAFAQRRSRAVAGTRRATRPGGGRSIPREPAATRRHTLL